MSGLGLVLSIAKDALAAQQIGVNVTAHNIANVSTDGYSRQTSVNEAKEPAPYAGLLLGRGVDTTQVLRTTDQFIEKQLRERKSDMLSYQELENYMQVLEGMFNENSESSISTMLSEFWNLWHDIANNPSGSPERIALYEHSILMSDQFDTLNTDLIQLQTDLTNAMNAGINEINQITSELAQVNSQLVGMETGTSIANDLRDKRNTLVSELGQYIDVKGFEQSNGTLTVVTARGCVLVCGNDSYNLVLGGDNGDRVMWKSDSGVVAGDITEYITMGKLGGWLEMRDEIIEKYKLDLNAMAKEFIWSVNRQHSQGVGLEAFNTVTGTYAVSDNGEELGTVDSGLDYYDKISDGVFNVWIYDSSGAVVGGGPTVITVDSDSGGTTLTSIKEAIDAVDNISATIATGGKLKIDADNGYTFAFSGDTSNVLAALGINTFFTGTTAGGIGVNSKIGSDKNFIAAAQIDSAGSYAAGDNTNAIAITDLQYTSMDIPQWTCNRIEGDTEGSMTASIDDYYHSMISSIGIKSSSISRGRAFNAVMVNKIEETRDSISGVSLDEEMTNLIKFQNAFQAAAKLITISDEMLNTLLSVK
ncbi:MAG: flagellar hook-associated protein FlgK [Deltaproteobacteria bacterium]|nr:MAG: flagellar hook-associated protein FlgK [Deltaproteobacteria bacterium]